MSVDAKAMDAKHNHVNISDSAISKDDVPFAIMDEVTLKSKIYTIRNQQVMLDFDLAAIYGYTTKAFNQQVKNNSDRFDSDFRFQLHRDELDNLRSNILTSSWGGNRYLPYAFTEQGIYMLMTVLRGPLAVQQSKVLIRLFKAMKDHLSEEYSGSTLSLSILSEHTMRNTKTIDELQTKLESTSEQLVQNSFALEKTQLTLDSFMASFGATPFPSEYIILQGKTLQANIAYQELYNLAKHTVIIVDNYLGLKTLLHLRHVPQDVPVYIFSDNLGKGITYQDLEDFQTEFPHVRIDLRITGGIIHDRFIILDHGFDTERVFLCGASSKDAGRKVSVIYESSLIFLYRQLVEQLFENQSLRLR